MELKRSRVDINNKSRHLLKELMSYYSSPIDQKRIIELALRYLKYKSELADNGSLLLEDVLLEGLLNGKSIYEAMFNDWLK